MFVDWLAIKYKEKIFIQNLDLIPEGNMDHLRFKEIYLLVVPTVQYLLAYKKL